MPDDLDQWDAAFVDDGTTTNAADAGDGAQTSTAQRDPEPMYPTVEAWVTEWLATIIRRPMTRETCWCPQWWQHAEAIVRLEALWRSWEHLRLDGNVGMSIWLRDHLDPHLSYLLNRDVSPFAKCDRTGHKGEYDPLPVEPAPEGWWGEPEQPDQ